MVSVCILSQSHLCRNPRVWKEAKLLSENGYTVTILTAIYSDRLLKEDEILLAGSGINYRFYSDTRTNSLKALKVRLIRKSAVFLQMKFKWESVFSLGYAPRELTSQIIRESAGLYIAHQELATVVASRLAGSFPIAFDLEDWYSEDLLPHARRQRPIGLLKQAESAALKNGAYTSTTSNALARRLSAVYGGAAPKVIYNVFPLQEKLLTAKKDYHKTLKICWFSQTIGEGRGLEEFLTFAALLRTGLEFNLMGNIDDCYRNTLVRLLPPQHTLVFHQLVSNLELPDKIGTFDIGLALEKTTPASRDLTVTNKFFQYLQAGLPVISTATTGQEEVFSRFRPGYLLSDFNAAPQHAPALDSWLQDPAALSDARERSVRAARFYCWENEAKKMTALVNAVI